MSYLKKYGLRLLFNMGEVLILLFITTLFYYYDLVSENTYKFLKLIILLVTVFINSFSLGKESDKLGYLEGIRYGSILILLSLIPSIISNKIGVKIILFYLIIISISIVGSVVGINKKRNKS